MALVIGMDPLYLALIVAIDIDVGDDWLRPIRDSIDEQCS